MDQQVMSEEGQLLFTILEYATPVVVALLGWLSARLIRWLKEKTKSEMLSNTMIRLNDSVLTYVREAEQTLVAELKKARAEDSPGGVLLTDNEARNVKKMVIDNVRRMWGEKGIEDLKKVLGVDDAGLQKYLEAKIEESVLTEKRSSLPPAPPEEKEEGDG